ncbi:MAG TPA: cupin domain-containing protein [Elusimicrobiales bacterium]|nr:cupin domain-containing protein [Elusimicrobiales bacterium]
MKRGKGFVRQLASCKKFISADRAILRETLHPAKGPEKTSYSLAHAIVKPGVTTLKHRLNASAEVYFIISGNGLMYIDNRHFPVKAGTTVYIPPAAVQCIKNTGRKDLAFVCMVNPPWRASDEEILDTL